MVERKLTEFCRVCGNPINPNGVGNDARVVQTSVYHLGCLAAFREALADPKNDKKSIAECRRIATAKTGRSSPL